MKNHFNFSVSWGYFRHGLCSLCKSLFQSERKKQTRIGGFCFEGSGKRTISWANLSELSELKTILNNSHRKAVPEENDLKARRSRAHWRTRSRTAELLSHHFRYYLSRRQAACRGSKRIRSRQTERVLLWETRGISDWKMSGRPRTTSFAESCKPVPQPSAFGSMKVSSKYDFWTAGNLLLVLWRGHSCCWASSVALRSENSAYVRIDRVRHTSWDLSVTFGWNTTCPVLNRSACFIPLLSRYWGPAVG